MGDLQCHLAAKFCDDVRPTLLLAGSPLTATDVLQEDVSLAVIRHTLSQTAAFGLQAARTAVSRVKETQLQDLKTIIVPADMMLDVMAAILSPARSQRALVAFDQKAARST